MFGQPIAIVGDADIYHVSCAAEIYGAEDIEEVLNPTQKYDPYLGEGPKDGEGNVLGVVLEGQDEWAENYYCGRCHGPIVEE